MTPFGVYVHVPFCRERCDYCAFATYTDRDHLMERYADACVRELRQVFGAGDLALPTSIFFGGGTPSRLHPDTLCRILDAIPRPPGAEVTVECNPEDADDAHLGAYRRAGVTRVSFGLQSTQAHVLAGLGRRNVPRAAETISSAVHAAGFRTWNLDLIFGAATESDDDWAATLDHVLALEHPPPHLSAYGLTVEPGTPLAADRARHPDDDVEARRYEHAVAVLTAAGYAWRRSPTGRGAATGAGTTTSTGSRGTTSASVRRRTRTVAGRAGGTYGRPTATSMPWRPAARPRPAARC